jgi:hypothetical protein
VNQSAKRRHAKGMIIVSYLDDGAVRLSTTCNCGLNIEAYGKDFGEALDILNRRCNQHIPMQPTQPMTGSFWSNYIRVIWVMVREGRFSVLYGLYLLWIEFVHQLLTGRFYD